MNRRNDQYFVPAASLIASMFAQTSGLSVADRV
jgi:hypothetical protein